MFESLSKHWRQKSFPARPQVAWRGIRRHHDDSLSCYLILALGASAAALTEVATDPRLRVAVREVACTL